LYDDTARQVYRYLYRLSGGDAALAEDLTQETFLTAVRRFKDGRADEVTAQWLMGAARHKLLEHHRRAGREARRLRLVFSRPGDDALEPDRRRASHEPAVTLLRGLPGDQRTALALRYVEDLAVAEVASAMGRACEPPSRCSPEPRRALRVERAVNDG
jgi:RNA polymerase sigma-70 factor (ECF subfamily)